MEIGEKIFQKTADLIERIRTAGLRKNRIPLNLEMHKSSLTVFARILSGKPVNLHRAENFGGLSGLKIFLPSGIYLFPSEELNRMFYQFRICLLLQTGRDMGNESFTESEEKFEAFLDSWKLKNANEFFAPIRKYTFNNYNDYIINYIKNIKISESENSVMKNPVENLLADSESPDRDSTVIDGKAVENINSISSEKKPEDDYTLMHNFEKIETADEFNGMMRDMDGEDDLKNHSEALKDLNLKDTVRSDEKAHSIYRTDLTMNSTVGFAGDSEKSKGIYYSEWDFSRKQYKEKFCTVYPRHPEKSDHNYVLKAESDLKNSYEKLEKLFHKQLRERESLKRQKSGSEVDLDAVVDNYTFAKAGCSASEMLYVNRKPARLDLALLILIDISLSTDSYVQNQRIIDVEKKSTALFAKLLDRYKVHFQIDAFSSRTRNNCEYIHIKTFSEKWKSRKHFLGGISPEGYTRIGPALRHSYSIMENISSKRRAVILLSDGKPNDYDHYEGNYGIQDIRKAVKKAEIKSAKKQVQSSS
ncbi:MAG TPA: hypothetical protein PKK94_14230, partial [Leptospiraceae bacterium]|nr:hypothetical protein [Leptospiraceae bacterium]